MKEIRRMSKCDVDAACGRVFTKGQRQAAPLDVLIAASSPIRVHEHSKLCHIINITVHPSLLF